MNTLQTTALVTGACGGMGRICARLLGRRSRLALTDISADKVAAFAAELRREGYDVAVVHGGDISEPGVADAVVNAAMDAAPLAAVAHTAGVSPALGAWDVILRANLIGTERLLLALEALPEGQFAVVIVASMAGHMAEAAPHALDAVLDAPFAPDLMERARPMLDELANPRDRFGPNTVAYNYAKSANLRSCRARAVTWAPKGRRINTVSPGMVSSPMGEKEIETNPMARSGVAATPMGRMGTPLDVANAVDFLTSPLSAYVTGADLLIDGGLVAFLRGQGMSGK